MGILDFEITRKQVALIVTLLCIIPFFVVIGLPLTIGQPTKDFYDELEKLPEGSKIVWAQQMGVVNYETYKYGFRAVLLQHAEKGHIVIVCSFEADTPTLLLSLHEWTKAQTGMVYGEDYVVLPYLAGFDTALAAMAENMRLFDTDATGVPIDQLPAMDGINTLNDFDMAITSYGYNDWPEAFIRQWPAKYGIRSMTMLRSFSDITQYYGTYIFGSLDSVRGAAEYEKLTGYGGNDIAVQDANSLSLSFILIIMFFGMGQTYYKSTQEKKEIQV